MISGPIQDAQQPHDPESKPLSRSAGGSFVKEHQVRIEPPGEEEGFLFTSVEMGQIWRSLVLGRLDLKPPRRLGDPGPNGGRCSRVGQLLSNPPGDDHPPKESRQGFLFTDPDGMTEGRGVGDDPHPLLSSRQVWRSASSSASP